ncbi:GtrA family protein [Staphylococcus gallinarum]|uniref:GtrA family protein n=1 Tax=Staphylococcus gallinarum TaxID=1293 RepID=A0A3A0VS95_STAGA|nr:GtrA family protein [Staphylococcus gallinarum]RIP37314.1 GtrA family protein [Staphylococcus gallinarum]
MNLTKTHIEIIKFIIVGGINTVDYYIVYLFLLKLIGLNYLISHLTGFIVSFIISYYLNCYFVYRVTPTWKKFIQFPITQVINMGMQTLLLYVFVQWLHVSSVIAPFAGLIITIPITFILSKYILRDET